MLEWGLCSYGLRAYTLAVLPIPAAQDPQPHFVRGRTPAVSPETGEVRWVRSIGQATYASDGTPALVSVFDLDERFLVANHAVAGLLNSSQERMIGRKRSEFMPEEAAGWRTTCERDRTSPSAWMPRWR